MWTIDASWTKSGTSTTIDDHCRTGTLCVAPVQNEQAERRTATVVMVELCVCANVPAVNGSASLLSSCLLSGRACLLLLCVIRLRSDIG